MTRLRRDIDDLDDADLLDTAEENQRRAEWAKERAEESARLERMEHVQYAAEQRSRAETAARFRAANIAHVLNGYRAAGLEPPLIQPGQTPCSLQLLLSIGWTIQDISGKKVLVRPPPIEKFEGFRDSDSLP